MFPRGLIREYSSPLSFIARFLDVMCVFLSGILVTVWRFDAWLVPVHYQIALLLGVLFTLIVFPLSGIYQSWRASSWLHQARVVTVAWGAILASLIIVAYLTETSALYSREWMAM